MRLTLEQRITALERENVVIQGRITILHKMLKEQRELIKEYITKNVSSSNSNEAINGNKLPERREDAVFTFICKKKFDRLEKCIERLSKTKSDLMPELKAG